jgi:hypothetical protein
MSTKGFAPVCGRRRWIYQKVPVGPVALICGISVLVVVGAPIRPAEGGTVARWHFDEAPGATVAADSVGSLDGSLEGSAEFVSGGISGNAVFMTAVGGGYVTMGDVLPMTSGDFSIAVWVRTSVSGESFLVGKHLSGSAPGYFVGLNSSQALGQTNKTYFYNNNGGTPNPPVSTTTINDDVWHLIVAVYHAGGKAEIFVDGGPWEGSQDAHTIVQAAAHFMVGGLTVGGNPTSFFTGWVDELQVFDHSLSQCEVEFLHSNPGAALPEPGLMSRWKFDESAGTTAADSVGTRHGTLYGDAVFVPGGVVGNAVSMSSAGDGGVTMGDVLPMNHCGDFSVAIWVKTTVAGESFAVGRHSSGSAPGYFVGLNSSQALGAPNRTYFYNSNGGNPNAPVSTTTINDDAWHQIVAVYHAGGDAEIFVDDGPAEGTQPSHTILKNVAPFLVGGLTVGGSPTSFYTGLVDELRVFGHALDQAEVEHLYFNPGDSIFADGFESGDLTEWSSSVGAK